MIKLANLIHTHLIDTATAQSFERKNQFLFDTFDKTDRGVEKREREKNRVL